MDFADAVIGIIDNLDTPHKHYRLLEQLEAAVTSAFLMMCRLEINKIYLEILRMN